MKRSFGPNTFPAHNSVLFTCEVQVEFIIKTLFSLIISNRASVVEVKQEAEDEFASGVQGLLAGTVFSAQCSNWYINSAGKNSASWPGYASSFWRETMFPRFQDFKHEGGSKLWLLRGFVRRFLMALQSKYSLVLLLTLGLVGGGLFENLSRNSRL